MKRVWIDSQTEEEIRRGINEAKDLSEYDSLSNSAFLRAKEDYLIGINFSRLLSIIFGRKLAQSINEEKASISIGRVMTCVLGMIVSREREIRNFVKTKYYKLNSSFENFTAEWKVNPKSSVFESPKLYYETGFKKEEDAKKLASVQVGSVVKGTVESLQSYGAFVRLENGLSGLVHISQISTQRIKSADQVLHVGDEVDVKVIGIKDGKISLSIKALAEDAEKEQEEELEHVEIPKAEAIGTSLGDLFKNIKL